MKPAILLLTFLFVFKVHTWAQKSETIMVTADQDLIAALSPNQLYRYPQFTPGRITFLDGKTSSGRLNYNLLLGEMQFVNHKGDTLTVDNEHTIKYVIVSKDSFYFQNGYLEWITGNANAQLLKKQYLKELDKRKVGGYGENTSTSAIATYNSYLADNTVYKLSLRGDILLAKKVDYYIGNSNHTYLFANKKNIMKLFPKQETAISKYLQQNEIDFKNEADLLKLLSFLQSL
jgi:hypothetical protein